LIGVTVEMRELVAIVRKGAFARVSAAIALRIVVVVTHFYNYLSSYFLFQLYTDYKRDIELILSNINTKQKVKNH
jgi:hypothetical protein